MTEQHVLLIPPKGLMEVMHADRAVDIEQVLASREGKGPLITLNLLRQNVENGTVYWCNDPTQPMNPRAREAMVMVTDAHMVFPGPVIFTGLPPEKVFEIVSALSRKD